MKVLYRETLAQATSLTSPEASPSVPIGRLTDPRLSTYAVFVTSTGTVTITAVFASAVTADTLAIAGHDFDPAATVSVNGSTPVSLSEGLGTISFPSDSQTTWTFVISEPAVADQIRKIGRLEFGVAFELPGISTEVKVDEIAQSRTIISGSRQSYGYRLIPYRRISVQFPGIEQNEKPALDDFYRYVDTFLPFFLIITESCLTLADLYAVLEETRSLSYQLNDANFYSSTMTFSEVN